MFRPINHFNRSVNPSIERTFRTLARLLESMENDWLAEPRLVRPVSDRKKVAQANHHILLSTWSINQSIKCTVIPCPFLSFVAQSPTDGTIDTCMNNQSANQSIHQPIDQSTLHYVGHYYASIYQIFDWTPGLFDHRSIRISFFDLLTWVERVKEMTDMSMTKYQSINESTLEWIHQSIDRSIR